MIEWDYYTWLFANAKKKIMLLAIKADVFTAASCFV